VAPAQLPQASPTLSIDAAGATDEVHAQTRRRSKARLLLVGTLGVIGLGAVAALILVMLVQTGEEGGTVEVISVPEGAVVTFDGRKIPKVTPVLIPVSEINKPHDLEVNLSNFQPWRRNLSLTKEDTKIRVLAVLTPIYGRLDVRSVPKGAEIYINGENRGQTPATIDNLLPNENVRLELRMRGYRPTTRIIKWADQTYRSVEVTLRPYR
jgi:hypothetical protein